MKTNLLALMMMSFLAPSAFAKVSLSQCLKNVNDDLKIAVKATQSTDSTFGVQITDFTYSGVSDKGNGNFTQYIMTMKIAGGNEQVAVGSVALDENCRIAGSEKLLGLEFDPVMMKLK